MKNLPLFGKFWHQFYLKVINLSSHPKWREKCAIVLSFKSDCFVTESNGVMYNSKQTHLNFLLIAVLLYTILLYVAWVTLFMILNISKIISIFCTILCPVKLVGKVEKK